MLISKQILVSALILSASVASLTGCGQTGSLYLPAPSAPANTASGAPDSATLHRSLPPVIAIYLIAA
ncbi:MAG: lipoprotein [Rhodoferax sp.]|nr:lipoprotein [Rhodoferax sp.]